MPAREPTTSAGHELADEMQADRSGSVPTEGAKLADDLIAAQALAGRVVGGRFQLISVLGKGGMGVVYEAVHVATRKRAAVKVIIGSSNTPKEMLARFTREAQATGSLNSEHIVQIFDTGTDEPTRHPYIAMELLVGETLSSLSKRLGPLPPDVALRLVAHILLGLAKAHDAGVVHRDIKPANVFVVQTDTGDCVAKILDFGIAKVLGREANLIDGENTTGGITATGMFLGSPRYMAPEQMLNRGVDHRADLWSAGAVLCQLLTGRVPFDGIDSIAELVIAVCNSDPPDVTTLAPWTPPPVAAIVRRSLQNLPDRRFSSAREMLEEVRAIVGDSLNISAKQVVSLGQEAASPRPSAPHSTPRAVDVSPRAFVAANTDDLFSSNPDKEGVTAERGVPLELATEVRRPESSPSFGALAEGRRLLAQKAVPLVFEPGLASLIPPSRGPSTSPAPPVPPILAAPVPVATPSVVSLPETGVPASERVRGLLADAQDALPPAGWWLGPLVCVGVTALVFPLMSLVHSFVAERLAGVLTLALERSAAVRVVFLAGPAVLVAGLLRFIVAERIGKIWYAPCAGLALTTAMASALIAGVVSTPDSVTSALSLAFVAFAITLHIEAARGFALNRTASVLRAVAATFALFGAVYMG